MVRSGLTFHLRSLWARPSPLLCVTAGPCNDRLWAVHRVPPLLGSTHAPLWRPLPDGAPLGAAPSTSAAASWPVAVDAGRAGAVWAGARPPLRPGAVPGTGAACDRPPPGMARHGDWPWHWVDHGAWPAGRLAGARRSLSSCEGCRPARRPGSRRPPDGWGLTAEVDVVPGVGC